MNINDYVYVPLKTQLYKKLLERYPEAAHKVIEDVVFDFLDRTEEDFELEDRGGIYWDRALLREGTKIRTKYFNEYQVGEVVGDRLVWEGRKYVSVSQLINAMRGGTSNNAWKVAEVQRPEDLDWIKAERLR